MKNKKMSIFSINLKKIRRSRGLSQQDLADKSGLATTVISYYETKSSSPPIARIKIIADVLGVSTSDLLDEKKAGKKSIYEDTDPRTLKKIKKIQSLPAHEQKAIWHNIKTVLDKYELKNEQKGKK